MVCESWPVLWILVTDDWRFCPSSSETNWRAVIQLEDTATSEFQTTAFFFFGVLSWGLPPPEASCFSPNRKKKKKTRTSAQEEEDKPTVASKMITDRHFLWDYRYRIVLPEELISLQRQICGNISRKSFITHTASSLICNEVPLQIQTSGLKQINSVTSSATAVRCTTITAWSFKKELVLEMPEQQTPPVHIRRQPGHQHLEIPFARK